MYCGRGDGVTSKPWNLNYTMFPVELRDVLCSYTGFGGYIRLYSLIPVHAVWKYTVLCAFKWVEELGKTGHVLKGS